MAIKTKIISVFSPKGGAGATMTCLHFGELLVKELKRTLVVDMTLFGGLEAYYRVPQTDAKGMSGVITSIDQGEDDQTIKEKLKDGIFTSNEGLEILFAASMLKMDNLQFEQVKELLMHLSQLEYDVILLDLSSDLHERIIASLHSSDQVINVLTPNIYSVWSQLKCLDVFDSLDIERKKIRYVVNNVRKDVGFNREDYLQQLNVDDLIELPNVKGVMMEQGNLGKSLHQTKMSFGLKAYMKSLKKLVDYAQTN